MEETPRLGRRRSQSVDAAMLSSSNSSKTCYGTCKLSNSPCSSRVRKTCDDQLPLTLDGDFCLEATASESSIDILSQDVHDVRLVNGVVEGLETEPEAEDTPICPAPATVERQKSFERLEMVRKKQKGMCSSSRKGSSDETCFICMCSFTRRNPAIDTPCAKNCKNVPVHAKCIFEWSEGLKSDPKIQEPPTCPLCRGPLSDVPYTPVDLLRTNLFFMFGFRKAFVTLPIPRNVGIVRCYLKAERRSQRIMRNRLETVIVWKMYLQAPPKLRYPLGPKPQIGSPVEGDQLLMVARKRKSWRNCIDISLDVNGKDFSRKGVNYVGSVRSSSLGLEHTIVSPVQDPSVPRRGKRVNYMGLGNVKYTQNRFGRTKGPRRMQLTLPNVNIKTTQNIDLCYQDVANSNVNYEEDSDADYSDDDEDKEVATPKWITKAWRTSKAKSLRRKIRRGKQDQIDEKSVIFASNREPYWLEQINAYSLDFQGRVTLPSNKNFQLVTKEKQNEVVLQFGKVVETNHTEIYTLDIQWPMSPLQAFGISLSACDRKLACA